MATTKVSESGVYSLIKYLDVNADNTQFGTYWFNIISPATGVTSSFSNIDTDSSNNIYVGALYTESANSRQAVYKIQSNGAVTNLYTNKVTGIDTPGASTVSLDSSGNIYLGASRGSGEGTMTKLNSSGVNQWTKRYRQSSVTYNFTMSDTSPAGNTYHIGTDNGRTLSYPEIHFGCYDTDGNEKWGGKKPIAANEYFSAYAIHSMGNDRAVFTFPTNDSPQRSYVSVATGTSNSTQVYSLQVYNTGAGSNRSTITQGLTSDSSNNVYGAGYWQEDASGGVINALLYKINSTGTLQWARRIYNTSSSKYAQYFDVASDSSANLYAIGSFNDSVANSNGLVAKYNTSGTIQWQRFIRLYDVARDAYGSFGMSNIEIDSSGDLVISARFYPSSSNPGYSALVVMRLPNTGSFTTASIPFTYRGVSYIWSVVNGTGTESSVSPATATYGDYYGSGNGSPQADTGTGGTGTIGITKGILI